MFNSTQIFRYFLKSNSFIGSSFIEQLNLANFVNIKSVPHFEEFYIKRESLILHRSRSRSQQQPLLLVYTSVNLITFLFKVNKMYFKRLYFLAIKMIKVLKKAVMFFCQEKAFKIFIVLRLQSYCKSKRFKRYFCPFVAAHFHFFATQRKKEKKILSFVFEKNTDYSVFSSSNMLSQKSSVYKKIPCVLKLITQYAESPCRS